MKIMVFQVWLLILFSGCALSQKSVYIPKDFTTKWQ